MQYRMKKNKKSKQMEKFNETLTASSEKFDDNGVDVISSHQHISLQDVLSKIKTLTPKDFEDPATWWKLGYYLEAHQAPSCEDRDALDAIFLGVLERLLIWCNTMPPETASHTMGNLRDTKKSLLVSIGKETKNGVRRELVALLWTARVTYASIQEIWDNIAKEGDDELQDVLYYRLGLHALYNEALTLIQVRDNTDREVIRACQQAQRRFDNFIDKYQITKPQVLAAILPRVALAKKLQYQLSADDKQCLRHNIIIAALTQVSDLSYYQNKLMLQQRFDLEMPSRH